MKKHKRLNCSSMKQCLAEMKARLHLNRMRLRLLPPRGSERKVMSTPGSTWATHSFASSSSLPPAAVSSSSSSPARKSVRALTEGVTSPLDTAPPVRSRGVDAAELPARWYA
ncbi:hypothetical protein U9M48_038632 [Paspalum notatum var. saurae]|uniref:Uncharacterized protein n=1 Tax=Paspalum notatum var. saurae TaxID=547442 RepID=A0AAQ3UID5_PASNO